MSKGFIIIFAVLDRALEDQAIAGQDCFSLGVSIIVNALESHGE